MSKIILINPFEVPEGEKMSAWLSGKELPNI